MGARISGHVLKVKRSRGYVWYLKLRLPDPKRPGRTMSTRRALGPAWTERSKPPEGYYTEKTAKLALADLLADARKGTLSGNGVPGSAPTFGQAVEEWLRHIEREGVSHTYKRNCESAVRNWITPAFGADAPVASIEDTHVNALRDELQDHTKLSASTVKKAMVMLHGIMRCAMRKKWITVNPCADAGHVKLPRGDANGELNVLSVEEVYAVARAAKDEQLGAMYVVAALTGLRMGELRALRWMDVDFTARTVHVRGSYAHRRKKAPKSGKVRSVPMADQVAVALDGLSKREHFTQPGDLVFATTLGQYLDDKWIRNAFYRALKKAGMGHRREGDDPFVFHDLRHTFGTLCASSGVPVGDIKTYMGHANLSTTQIYMHFAPKHDEAQRLTEAFGAGDASRGTRLAVR